MSHHHMSDDREGRGETTALIAWLIAGVAGVAFWGFVVIGLAMLFQ